MFSDILVVVLLLGVFLTGVGAGISHGQKSPKDNLQCTEQQPIENTYPVVNECIAWKLKENK